MDRCTAADSLKEKRASNQALNASPKGKIWHKGGENTCRKSIFVREPQIAGTFPTLTTSQIRGKVFQEFSLVTRSSIVHMEIAQDRSRHIFNTSAYLHCRLSPTKGRTTAEFPDIGYTLLHELTEAPHQAIPHWKFIDSNVSNRVQSASKVSILLTQALFLGFGPCRPPTMQPFSPSCCQETGWMILTSVNITYQVLVPTPWSSCLAELKSSS